MQAKYGKHLEDFQRYNKYRLPSIETVGADCSREALEALYATEFFGPLNHDRYKNGLTAYEAGGMHWQAWLNLEAALIEEYIVYLMRFANHEERMKWSKDMLNEARENWINDQLEKKFRIESKAFWRCQGSCK